MRILYSSQELTRLLADIHQITRDEQKAGHVERINHLLDFRIKLLEIDQVETDDEQDENALQIVKFLDAFHCVFLYACYLTATLRFP